MMDKDYKFNNSHRGEKRAPSMQLCEFAELHELHYKKLAAEIKKQGTLKPAFICKKKIIHDYEHGHGYKRFFDFYNISDLNAWAKDNQEFMNKIKL